MAEPALKRMSITAFLDWESPPDTHYQLLDGVPVAMAPPARAHGLIAGTLGRRLAERLDALPGCTVQPQAGIALWQRDTWYEADLAVSCTPHQPDQRETPDPVLIVEILSPSTERHDRGVKLPDYRRLPSVREVVLIDSRRMLCEVHRRQPDGRWITDILQQPEERLLLESIGFDQPLSAIYANVVLEEETWPSPR